jgi:hypothetical protein
MPGLNADFYRAVQSMSKRTLEAIYAMLAQDHTLLWLLNTLSCLLAPYVMAYM